VTRILSKVGVKEFKGIFENEDTKAVIKDMVEKNNGELHASDLASIGIGASIDVAATVLEHMEDCEKDVYKLLSRLSGLSEAEIAELPMAEFGKMVMSVIKHEGFRDFFTAVMSQFK
jgi:hypothetical protein